MTGEYWKLLANMRATHGGQGAVDVMLNELRERLRKRRRRNDSPNCSEIDTAVLRGRIVELKALIAALQPTAGQPQDNEEFDDDE